MGRVGCSKLEFKDYVGLTHSVSSDEITDFVKFVRRLLPALNKESDTSIQMFEIGSTVPTHRTIIHEGICRVEIDLPSIDSVDVDICATEIRVTGRFCLNISWPVTVDTAQSTARFDKKKCMLIVRARA